MMFLRVLELCLTLVAVALTWKEVLSPLLREQPLFPMLRKAMEGDGEKKPAPQNKKTH